MRLWKWFMAPSTRCGWGAFALIGAAAVVIFMVAFNAFADYTNRLEFCVSCHAMQQNFDEYKKSIHYHNRTGVQAECSDCHVPKGFAGKLLAKVMAAHDVWHTIIGTIDTPEKFAAHRLEMAERVWAKMEANGSAQCRQCHKFDAMDLEQQGRRSRMKHEAAVRDGKTCVNCHKGLVHELPDNYVRE